MKQPNLAVCLFFFCHLLNQMWSNYYPFCCWWFFFRLLPFKYLFMYFFFVFCYYSRFLFFPFLIFFFLADALLNHSNGSTFPWLSTLFTCICNLLRTYWISFGTFKIFVFCFINLSLLMSSPYCLFKFPNLYLKFSMLQNYCRKILHSYYTCLN